MNRTLHHGFWTFSLAQSPPKKDLQVTGAERPNTMDPEMAPYVGRQEGRLVGGAWNRENTTWWGKEWVCFSLKTYIQLETLT